MSFVFISTKTEIVKSYDNLRVNPCVIVSKKTNGVTKYDIRGPTSVGNVGVYKKRKMGDN